jgi:hypothetical protein
MAANPELVKEMGVSADKALIIDSLHEQLDYIIDNADCSEDRSQTSTLVTDAEYKLQELWGFTRNSLYHTWGKRLQRRFREIDYLDAVYRCKETGARTVISSQALHSGLSVRVGLGFIDFGSVVRLVGPIERVK